ncbi:MAG: EAL domain-containing protein [Pseudomonadota bacterium]
MNHSKLIKLGLIFLIAFQVVSFVWVYACIKNVKGYSEVIDIIGQQRMLTKHLGMLALLSENADYVDTRMQATNLAITNNNAFTLEFLSNKANSDSQRVFLENVIEHHALFYESMKAYLFRINPVPVAVLQERVDHMEALHKDVAKHLVSGSKEKQAVLVNAIIGSFLLFSFIIWYMLVCIVKPLIVKDKSEIQEFADSLSVFKSFFTNSNDAVLIFDGNWQLVEANESSFKITNQQNHSLKISSQIWLNKILNSCKLSMTDQLRTVGQWQEKLQFESLERDSVYLAGDGVKVYVEKEQQDYYVLTFRDITDLQKKQIETEKLASTDALTGFLNRFAGLRKLEEACVRARESNQLVGVLFADLDAFKKINDVHGHYVGDTILRDISSRLRGLQTDNIKIARYGGDEFVFVCEQANDRKQFYDLASTIVSLFDEPFIIKNLTWKINISIGISVYPDHSKDFSELIRLADIAMYNIKGDKDTSSTFFSKDMTRLLSKKDTLENEIKLAVPRREFKQVFQPIVDLSTGQVVGAELLLRWNNKTLGAVPPDKFIPVAEQIEHIYEIDRWSWQACLKSFEDIAWDGYLSINLSSLHFKKTNVIDTFLTSLNRSRFKNKVIFEITETAIVENIESSTKLINKIKHYGYSVAIDDFGTGYTSLYYLKILPIDYLKIDKSFVYDITENENSASIVRAMIGLAMDLNIKVIAEGIESEQVEKSLRRSKAHYAQGYHYSKPVPIDDFYEKFVKPLPLDEPPVKEIQ